MTITIHHGDSREVLKAMPDACFHAVVCDPPYSLGPQRTQEIGHPSWNGNTKRVRTAAKAGFMGKQWDTGETAFDPAFWAEVYRVLKPGGHLIAFGGTRTYHRLACAIEDAGFEVRDMLAWMFGSGFPKSHNVAKGIDKAAGRPIEIVPNGAPVKRMIPGADQAKAGWEKNNGREYQPGQYVPSEEAEPWAGWGTALKPAHEPICLARKPLSEGTVAGNVLAHGCGAINVDACRVEGEKPEMQQSGYSRAGKPEWRTGGATNTGQVSNVGRWPANVVLSWPEDEYVVRPDVTAAEKAELYRWLNENT